MQHAPSGSTQLASAQLTLSPSYEPFPALQFDSGISKHWLFEIQQAPVGALFAQERQFEEFAYEVIAVIELDANKFAH